ncbi:Receptor-like serine/threonine-protein kinase SD1-8 [Morus notabilis]|uniref:Receptor-like serine/threonine-protein kinase n=1 Tax=Morus notabilis TaxID=981085 RepID=W9QMB6_9ROSA|nr:G-type lectin S-receptor-like serine/threonine-protein kinase At4g27290 [Morus notabilis]EXB28513.1 Receptor-like serine/threonine-protein kinase SD1-8 [Morus notabilis]
MEALQLCTILISFVLSLLPLLQFSWAAHIDAITPNQSLKDDSNLTTLISPGQTFEIGFFSPPGNSKNRYLGMWYKRKPETIVWIANRNTPLTEPNGEFAINAGKLVLLNSTRSVIWFPNVSSNVANSPIALLLDRGNLVLQEQENANSDIYLWQSFDYPTDTLLNGMKLGWDLNTGFERYLTSWKSADDPSSGDVTYRMNVTGGLFQSSLKMDMTKKFRSGIWNGIRFSGVKEQLVLTVFNIVHVFNEEEAYLMVKRTDNSTISLAQLNYSGFVQHLVLLNETSKWTAMYTSPTDEQCDSYGHCGANAMCTSGQYPILCDCLTGYTPSSEEEWRGLTWSKGCVRKTPLGCEKGEGFEKVAEVKLPDLLDFSFNKNMNLRECKEACLNNCSCIAFANSDITKGGSGCLRWFGDLIDIRDMPAKGSEQDLYIRLSAAEMKSIRDANKKKTLKIILSASLSTGAFMFCVAFWCIRWKLRKRVKGKSKDEDVDLPTFDLAAIVAATNNFSAANIIGSGGFGPVYKGKLSTGQDLAVKRLSKNSGQGFTEFKNEVELIVKLQHRNLVALLGCCIQKEERILIYEYMPNKSLDHYIFDGKRCTTLPWHKHFNIIRGIARGLLYLHQDSKLRIVHRDLKASNILLDNNLDPKISDFGLARIFGDDDREEKTKRIVGTYGYISPEYVIDGKFSVKSDVFSFGVVMLETVSGKKNRSFNHKNHQHNLLGHAWLLWNQGKALDLMNVCFNDSYVESQVLRCIQVGLLCVQKFPYDRPTMSSVVFMLENEGSILPQPKEPGFFMERSSMEEGSTSEYSRSKNIVTVTLPSGR